MRLRRSIKILHIDPVALEPRPQCFFLIFELLCCASLLCNQGLLARGHRVIGVFPQVRNRPKISPPGKIPKTDFGHHLFCSQSRPIDNPLFTEIVVEDRFDTLLLLYVELRISLCLGGTIMHDYFFQFKDNHSQC